LLNAAFAMAILDLISHQIKYEVLNYYVVAALAEETVYAECMGEDS
jgi:hypothetical protein